MDDIFVFGDIFFSWLIFLFWLSPWFSTLPGVVDGTARSPPGPRGGAEGGEMREAPNGTTTPSKFETGGVSQQKKYSAKTKKILTNKRKYTSNGNTNMPMI